MTYVEEFLHGNPVATLFLVLGLGYLVVPPVVAGIGLGIGVVTVIVRACSQGDAWFRGDGRLAPDGDEEIS